MFRNARLDRLIALQEETNLLLRELIGSLTGNRATTRQPLKGPIRQSTDKDVRVITRADRLRMQAEAKRDEAPWRTPTPVSGPASGTTSTAASSNSDAASPVGPPRA